MQLQNFTYSEYIELLNILKSNRVNLTFREWDKLNAKPNSFFLLRHDIDYSLTSALEMAKIENSIGIKATYFLLMSSNNYNLLSEEYCNIPKQLIELGHEVGLHYDVQAIYKRDKINFTEQLELEIDILSKLSNKKITSIAMHNPSIYGKDPFKNIANYINAYNEELTQNISYYSDSCGAWRDNAYYSFMNNKLPNKLQLLIHPIFWSKNNTNRWIQYENFLENKINKLKKEKIDIFNIWKNHIGLKEHEARSKI